MDRPPPSAKRPHRAPSPLSSGSRRKRRLAAALAVAGLLARGGSALAIRAVSAGRVFSASSIAELPPARAAVVLGCAERLPGGAYNLYFLRRIAAAAELYRAGKAACFIVSGDNHAREYDEASAMKSALAAAGVPGERIVCDYAGFRTLDTVVRAKEVFGLDSFIVVSQPAHVRRAVFTARGFGCDAWGYEADGVHGPDSWRTTVREQFAKVAAAWDVLVRRRPKFLGPRETLPSVAQGAAE